MPAPEKPTLDPAAIRDYLLTEVRGGLDAAGWHTPLADAVRGLCAAQALWRPAPGLYNIWELVNHITVWKEEAARWLRGLPRTEELFQSEAAGWPPAPAGAGAGSGAASGVSASTSAGIGEAGIAEADSAAEAKWQETVAALRAAHENLTAALEETDVTPVAADAPHPLPRGLGFAAGTPSHDSYHGSQIILIRKLQGSWAPPKTGSAE